MRRGLKFSKRSYIILGFVGFFNLLAISFDQLVVQQEDKIRKFDYILNDNKINTQTLLYAHDVFDELMYKTHFTSSSLISNLNYQVRAINFFNSDIEKKIKNENIDELILIYESKTKEIIKKYTVSKEETYFLLKTIFESDTLKKALKNEESEKLWNQQELLKLYDFFGAKYNNKFLKEYNFEASTVSEQEKNYEIYSEFYKELLDYNFEKNTFSIFSKKFKSIFNRSFSNYYVLLDDYVDIKNTKNTLILLSILFQIIGLVALAILFRNLVLENK
mgnify:CR=1 FL=1|tara:strand:- start:1177 stop:2004 length:828 start_codon:yes stop_codon:yes gene_type:complete